MKIFNSISGKKETFKPIKKGRVSLYTCGPTVYDFAHIGNYRTFLFEDLLKRVLLAKGYTVKHIMNITDVDDKTINKCNDLNIDLKDFTNNYSEIFFEEIKALNILPADCYPKATDYIDKMIEIIDVLLKNRFAYKNKSGDVYFSVDSFPDYGQLVKIDSNNLKQTERILSDDYDIEDARDFALWKSYKKSDGNIFWESPWGKGRPGWHIECSAMSIELLGNHFDIHCGGIDNKFPHHENEIAQSVCYSGSKFVNYWMHSEFLLVEGEKMSKSKGNFYRLNDIVKAGISIEEFRFIILSSHYRSKIDFSLKKAYDAKLAIGRIAELKNKLSFYNSHDSAEFPEEKDRFFKALEDDLDSPKAIAIFFEWIKKINRKISIDKVNPIEIKKSLNFISFFDSIFNFLSKNIELTPEKLEKLLIKRDIARKNKDWKEADILRDEIYSLGWIISDSVDGPQLKKKL